MIVRQHQGSDPRRGGWARPFRSAALLLAGLATIACAADQPPAAGDAGGHLRLALRAEPRTFNPIVALDAASASLGALMHGELFRIDARTHEAVPELAERLEGPDADGGLTVTLRRNVVFPDGEPFGADDVVFSLTVFQDPALGSAQIQALRAGGQPTLATVVDSHTVHLTLGAPHPEPARLLAGTPMLPRHRLESLYRDGQLAAAWSLTDAPANIMGLGPFRLEEFVAGQRVTLTRNPLYWRRDAQGRALPYLDRLTASVISDPDAQVARLLAGELDLLSAIDTRALETVAAAGPAVQVHDLGPSLEYAFLMLNLDDPGREPRSRHRARWFHDDAFRQALSLAIDRDALVRLVYLGRARSLVAHVSPGNKRWYSDIPAPSRSVEEARRLLAGAGFHWNKRGRLIDRQGVPVSFSVFTSTSNPQRQRMAPILQADFDAIGIDFQVVAIEFRALVDRVTRTRDFDTAIMALGGGDPDPSAELNVWQRDGSTHLFRLGARHPLAPWEDEIDALMRQQAATVGYAARRALYARVQQLVASHLPIIPLVSPHHVVAVRRGLQGLAAGVTSRDSLWNVDELSWSAPATR